MAEEQHQPVYTAEVVRTRRPRRQNGWLGGLVILLVGCLFLLQNFGVIQLVTIHNWWALLLLIPAIGAFSAAAGMFWYNGGKLDRKVLGAAYGGMYPLVIAILFLLGADWGKWWPILVIMVGLGAVLFGRHNNSTA